MDYKKLLSGAATSYGTKNRNKAREECKKEIRKYHHNLEIKPTGLHANEKFSELEEVQMVSFILAAMELEF